MPQYHWGIRRIHKEAGAINRNRWQTATRTLSKRPVSNYVNKQNKEMASLFPVHSEIATSNGHFASFMENVHGHEHVLLHLYL